jgi:hypothetical protein
MDIFHEHVYIEHKKYYLQINNYKYGDNKFFLKVRKISLQNLNKIKLSGPGQCSNLPPPPQA